LKRRLPRHLAADGGLPIRWDRCHHPGRRDDVGSGINTGVGALFACLVNLTFSLTKEQYFLSPNQQTVLKGTDLFFSPLSVAHTPPKATAQPKKKLY